MVKVENRTLSICAFSLLFAYVLSFLFEGRVLYGLLDAVPAEPAPFIFIAVIAHFLGLLSCAFLCKSVPASKKAMLGGMGTCLALSPSFVAFIPAL